jgi:hypothetical protein
VELHLIFPRFFLSVHISPEMGKGEKKKREEEARNRSRFLTLHNQRHTFSTSNRCISSSKANTSSNLSHAKGGENGTREVVRTSTLGKRLLSPCLIYRSDAPSDSRLYTQEQSERDISFLKDPVSSFLCSWGLLSVSESHQQKKR